MRPPSALQDVDYGSGLRSLADEGHPDHAELSNWFDEYDPNVIDELPIKYALGRIAARRNAARKRLAKK